MLVLFASVSVYVRKEKTEGIIRCEGKCNQMKVEMHLCTSADTKETKEEGLCIRPS